MSNEDAWLLLKHMLEYTNDKNPEPPNTVVDLVFEPIKQQLKRDLRRYEEKCTKNKENVMKRWNKKDTTVYERIPLDTKHTDTDTDNDNDTDNDTDIKKNTAPKGAAVSKKFNVPTLEQVQEYCCERNNWISAEAFIAHYDAVGWVYGKDRKPVKDWKACVRTREQKRKEEEKAKEPQSMEQWRDLRDKMGIKEFTIKYWNEQAKKIMLYFL